MKQKINSKNKLIFDGKTGLGDIAQVVEWSNQLKLGAGIRVMLLKSMVQRKSIWEIAFNAQNKINKNKGIDLRLNINDFNHLVYGDLRINYGGLYGLLPDAVRRIKGCNGTDGGYLFHYYALIDICKYLHIDTTLWDYDNSMGHAKKTESIKNESPVNNGCVGNRCDFMITELMNKLPEFNYIATTQGIQENQNELKKIIDRKFLNQGETCKYNTLRVLNIIMDMGYIKTFTELTIAVVNIHLPSVLAIK